MRPASSTQSMRTRRSGDNQRTVSELELRIEKQSLFHQIEICWLAQRCLVLVLAARRLELQDSAVPPIEELLQKITRDAANAFQKASETLNEAGTVKSARGLRRAAKRLHLYTSQFTQLANTAKGHMIYLFNDAVEKCGAPPSVPESAPRRDLSAAVVEQLTAGIRSMQEAASRGDEYAKLALAGMAKDWEDTQRRIRWPLDG